MYHHYNAWDLYNVFIAMSVCVFWRKGILFTAGQNVDARARHHVYRLKINRVRNSSTFLRQTHLSVSKVVLGFSWIFQLGSYVMVLNICKEVEFNNGTIMLRTLCNPSNYSGYSWISHCQISKHKLLQVKVLLNCSAFFIIGLWIIFFHFMFPLTWIVPWKWLWFRFPD